MTDNRQAPGRQGPPMTPADARALIACETYPGYSHHLREIGDIPPHYGGHVKKPMSLCGRPIAWDTRIPVDGFDECPRCVSALERGRRSKP